MRKILECFLALSALLLFGVSARGQAFAWHLRQFLLRSQRRAGSWATPAGGGVTTIYKTSTTAAAASIPTTTMVTPSGNTLYLIHFYLAETVPTAGCTTQPSFTLNLIYTDANNNVAVNVGILMTAFGLNPGAARNFEQVSLDRAAIFQSEEEVLVNAKSGVAV